MRMVLDKLVELRQLTHKEDHALLVAAAQEFQLLLQREMGKILPVSQDYSPIVLADSLLEHMPSDHPAFYLNPLVLLDKDLYDLLGEEGSQEKFLLCEFYQGLQTKMEGRLKQLQACYQEYNQELIESIDNALKLDQSQKMAQAGELELSDFLDWRETKKRHTEALKAANPNFKLLHDKFLAVRDIVATLMLEEEIGVQLEIFHAKLQHYKEVLTRGFLTTGGQRVVNAVVDNSLWVGKVLVGGASRLLASREADGPTTIAVVLSLPGKKA